MVGRTHRRASAGHFLTAMEAAVGFPGPARSAGYDAARASVGCRQKALAGLREESAAVGAGGAPRSTRRARRGLPGKPHSPRPPDGGGGGGGERSWANALGLWAERLTLQRRAGGRFPYSQPRTPGLAKVGGFAR